MRSTWVWIAMICQFLAALTHAIGLFVSLPPANATEAELTKLMTEYKLNAGGGFHPSMENLFLSLSISFGLLLLFGGLLNLYFLRKKLTGGLLKHLLLIQVFIFGCSFVVMAMLTFLIPIISTGLIFISLVVAWVMTSRE